MEAWDQDAVDLLGPAYVEFGAQTGTVAFIAIEGDLDCRYDVKDVCPAVEFSWSGADEGTPVSGRGWARLEPRGLMTGRIFIHGGDDSAFTARREGTES